MSNEHESERAGGIGSSAWLGGVKAAPMEDCKQAWGFFDDMLPGEVMDTLMAWAQRGDTLEQMYHEIMTKNESKFIGMGDNGRKAMALAIEYAIRQAS